MKPSNTLSTASSTRWQWSAFDDLSGEEMYALLALRQDVFIVEQACRYRDIDWVDRKGWHLLGWKTDANAKEKLIAYLRCLPPGLKFEECALGRVVTAAPERGLGIGTALMQEGLRRAAIAFPAQSIRISAQQHLEQFYRALRFVTVSTPYVEDGITHIDMLRTSD